MTWDEGNSFKVQYNRIISDDAFLSSTRLLAMDIKTRGYILVSEYLQNLPDIDLKTLIHVSERPDDNDFGELLLIAEMLATAEGLDSSIDEETIYNRTKMLVAFLAVESLFRKGIIRIFRENMSFGEEYMDRKVAERIDDNE